MSAAHREKDRYCPCVLCVGARLDEFKSKLEVFREKTGVIPTSPDQTVFVGSYRVRAHAKRHPRQWAKDPFLKKAAHAYVKERAREAMLEQLGRKPRGETK